MDRTLQLMRRTLKCAVFACPLSLLSPWLGAACQLLFTLYAAAFLPVTAPTWKGRQVSPAVLMRRALPACCGALFLGFLPAFILYSLFSEMHPFTRQIIHLLSSFSAILLQNLLLRPLQNVPHPLLLSGILLMLLSVCMLSGA